MSFITYIVETNWKQKKSDWLEYRTLCRKFNSARGTVREMRENISSYLNVKEYSKPTACMNHVMDYDDLSEKLEYCQCFYLPDNKRGCYSLHCEYAEKNRLYHEACDSADKLHTEMNSFWQNKFAHIK